MYIDLWYYYYLNEGKIKVPFGDCLQRIINNSIVGTLSLKGLISCMNDQSDMELIEITPVLLIVVVWILMCLEFRVLHTRR